GPQERPPFGRDPGEADPPPPPPPRRALSYPSAIVDRSRHPGYSRLTVRRPSGGSGMKCPRCQQNNPSHAKFCLECGAPVHRAGNDVASARPYADVLRELGQALGQQTATSEILGVISSSPTDVQPVFDAIAAAATKLCAVESAGVYRFDGRLIHLAGHYQWTAEHLDAIARVFPQAIDG